MDIQLVKTADEARGLVAQGFCPVECRWGDVVVLDELELDHHGSMSDRGTGRPASAPEPLRSSDHARAGCKGAQAGHHTAGAAVRAAPR